VPLRPARPPAAAAVSALLAAACAPAAPAPARWTAGAAEPLPAADGVAAFDPDGDGVDEVAWARGGALQWSGGSVALEGAFQAAAALGAPGGGQRLFIATGAGRDHRDAAARVTELGPGGVRVWFDRPSPRAQITSLRPTPEGLWITIFRDDREVEGGLLREGGPLEVRAAGPLAMAMAPLPGGEVAVGRIYGDQPRSPGDLQVHGPSGRRALPGHRGVRALEAADLDGDGAPELISCDGWHAEYGQHADPRVALYDGPRMEGHRTIAWLHGSYACEQILVIGEGRGAALAVRGSRGLYLLQRDGLGWAADRLAELDEGAHLALARTADGVDLLASGPSSLRIPLVRR